MAHLVETMFYVGREPWHGLGIKLDHAPNSAEAIVCSGLDTPIETVPIFATAPIMDEMTLPDGTQIRRVAGYSDTPDRVVDGFKLIRRASDGAQYGVVGSKYTVVQNRDAFAFFDPLVEQGLAIYHTAGSLKGGRLVWILAQIGNEQTIIGEDVVSQFLLLNMGHDGTRGVQIMPTTIRVVCANTNGMAEAQAKAGRMMRTFNHTPGVLKRLEETREFITPYLVNFEATCDAFRVMAQHDLDQERVEAVLRFVFPDPTTTDGRPMATNRTEAIRAGIVERFEGSLIGMELVPVAKRRTGWTLYNAITEYVDHDRGRTDDSRLAGAWFGDGAAVKARAREALGVGRR